MRTDGTLDEEERQALLTAWRMIGESVEVVASDCCVRVTTRGVLQEIAWRRDKQEYVTICGGTRLDTLRQPEIKRVTQ